MGSTSPSEPAGGRGPSGSRRIAVLLDEAAEREATAPASLDHLAPGTRSIMAALESLGYEPVEMALRPDAANRWLERLAGDDFLAAFNLCETVDGRAAGEHLVAAAVELLGVPVTGASAATLLHCLDKHRCSAILAAGSVPVPRWLLLRDGVDLARDWDGFPAIVKPAAEDGSNGVHSNSVAWCHAELAVVVHDLLEVWDRLIVQEYVVGREINLAIVGGGALPPAEIDFELMPDGSPRIVTYEAKWVSGSPDDLGTRPICPASLDAGTARGLQDLAARAWATLDGHGYARVDVRLSEAGEPYVIDVNPNPDLSPDAGLARQAAAAGWTYEQLLAEIVADALRRHREPRVGGTRLGPSTAASGTIG